jgi:hypothetical protein
MSARDLEQYLDEYKDRDVIHFTYNAHTTIDTPHKPILSVDPFADKHFSKTPNGVLKVTAVSRSKVQELNDLLSPLKPFFDWETFPHVNEFECTEYKALTENTLPRLSMRLVGADDFKRLRDIEEEIRTHLAEDHYVREIIVGRHAVKGHDPELLLTTSEETTEKGFAFLQGLADYLPHVELAKTRAVEGEVDLLSILSAAEEKFLGTRAPLPTEAVVAVMSPIELRRAAVLAMSDTLKATEEFRGLTQVITGSTIQIQFTKGIMGFGGHFDMEHESTLGMVHRSIISNPKFAEGWSAHYVYDRTSRILSISAVLEGDSPPMGWATLY